MLSSRYAMWMGWGPELSFFYNAAYAEQTLGAKHPWALGRPACEVWAEIWPTLEVRIAHVLRTGEATWDEGLLLLLVRSGYPEETYHTFSYSAAPGEGPGEIGGLFCVVIEETERVINERRIAFLRDLASNIAQTKSAEQVYAALERSLSADARDMPFSATYLIDDECQTARRVSQTGFVREHRVVPKELKLADSSIWQLHSVIDSSRPVIIELPSDESWPTGPWENSPSRALVVPIAQQGKIRSAGAFVVGVNPHRLPDAALQSFVALVVGQLASGLSNAGAYEEAQRRAEVLAELDRAKTTFFSNVSHEFRTPLTLMLGPTEDALGSPERALRGAELEAVHRNALRLLKLVNGLLDFARIEAGRIQAAYEPIDLRELTVDLASTFRSAIERAALTFIVDCNALPESIYVDRNMWEKIVLNLLSNALKFTFDGAITVSLRWQNERAELTVEDTGVGIEASELPRLFERFHRIEGARARTHEGSGIGLALVHELVRLHGGSIEVTSNVGLGTRFLVAIPRGTAHLSADRIGAARSLATPSTSAAYVAEAMRWVPGPSGGVTPSAPKFDRSSTPEAQRPSARILVADDNADMREYITRLLQQHWTVDVAADGLEALECARRAPPDLVLSDIMMPRLDGYTLIRELRGDARTAMTPIILLSARAGEEATAEGLRSGADDYLVKPFSASALLVRVESQLSAARLREAMRRTAEAERQRLETMFRESPAAICVLRGPKFTIELANPNILALWKRPASVIGQPLFDVLPEMRGQGFEDVLRRVLGDRGTLSG
jgi:signal transduction histidine kinase/CheY-like chemotaxis protein